MGETESRCLSAGALLLLLLLTTACPSSEPANLAEIEDLRVDASPALIQALEGGDPARQARAARAMGRIQTPAYAAPLAAAATGQAPREVRLEALFALGQLGLAEGARPPEAAVQAVRQVLGAEDDELAAAAVEALGKLAPEGAAAQVLPLLDHGSAAVRAEAAHALFRLRFVPVWRRQAEEPPPLPPEAVTALAEALADPAPEVRRMAAHAFSRYGQPEAVAGLEQALGDEDSLVRVFAARALGKAGEAAKVAAPALVGLLEDADEHVRFEALAALAALEALEPAAELAATASLAPRGQDPSFHVRAAFARLLAGRQDAESLEVLRNLEKDPSPTVQAAALEGLARRLDGDYLPALQAALGAEAWTLRVAAARAAASLTHGEDAAALLRRALEDPDGRVKAAALEGLDRLEAAALEGLGGTAGRDELIAASLESMDLAVRGTAVEALKDSEHEKKVDWLKEAFLFSPGVEWVEVREGVVDALAAQEGAETDEFLARIAATDPAASVRLEAQTALVARGKTPRTKKAPPAEATALLSLSFEEDPVLVLETSKGNLVIRTFFQEAPVHVANFVELTRDGFYDGLPWHRVVPNFVIQGGDPLGSGWGGPGYALRDEINRIRFERGTVGMPKAGKDTGGCQIFITHVPTPHLDGNYTVFGQVIEGLEVIDRIEVGDLIVRAYVQGEG